MMVFGVLLGVEERDGHFGSSKHRPEFIRRGFAVFLHTLSPLKLRTVKIKVVIQRKLVVRIVGVGKLLFEGEDEHLDLLCRGQEGERITESFGHDCVGKAE